MQLRVDSSRAHRRKNGVAKQKPQTLQCRRVRRRTSATELPKSTTRPGTSPDPKFQASPRCRSGGLLNLRHYASSHPIASSGRWTPSTLWVGVVLRSISRRRRRRCRRVCATRLPPRATGPSSCSPPSAGTSSQNSRSGGSSLTNLSSVAVLGCVCQRARGAQPAETSTKVGSVRSPHWRRDVESRRTGPASRIMPIEARVLLKVSDGVQLSMLGVGPPAHNRIRGNAQNAQGKQSAHWMVYPFACMLAGMHGRK